MTTEELFVAFIAGTNEKHLEVHNPRLNINGFLKLYHKVIIIPCVRMRVRLLGCKTTLHKTV